MIIQNQRPFGGQVMRLKQAFVFIAIVVALNLWLTACQQKEKATDTTEKGDDYYRHQVKIKHAKGFSVKYFDHFKLVDIISPFERTADTTKYLLVERGTARPAGYTDREVIEIPVQKMVAMSSMHIGLLRFLDAEDILTGLGDVNYVYSDKVLEMIKTGKIVEIGKNNGVNQEKLITLDPDLLMVMGSPGAQNQHYPALKQAAIPVLANSEWGESTPLARAEWVKLMAALLNKEELVNDKFEKLEKEYEKLRQLAGTAQTKPTILSGLNMKDQWYLPSGENYMTAFFTDAGGSYHWTKESGTGSFSLNFEAVYPFALSADYWLNVGYSPTDTRQSILETDSRYGDFKAYKNGNMFSYNNKVSAGGCNDFFESGMMEPEVILADLIRILHPELLPDHQLVYYKQLP